MDCHQSCAATEPDMSDRIQQSNARVLEYLATAPGAKTVKEICDSTDLGEVIARRSIAVLVATGQISERVRLTRGVAGTPPKEYLLSSTSLPPPAI